MKWHDGVIPCDGWYYLRYVSRSPVWLRSSVSSHGYKILFSYGPEDDGHEVKEPQWRPAYQQLTTEQAQAELENLRRVPKPGDWGVLSSDEHGPHGTRPVDWRGTKAQAEDLARAMGFSWVAEVVKVPGGWSTGEPHEVSP